MPGHAAVAALTGRGAAVVTVLTGEVATRIGATAAGLKIFNISTNLPRFEKKLLT